MLIYSEVGDTLFVRDYCSSLETSLDYLVCNTPALKGMSLIEEHGSEGEGLASAM